MSALRAWAILAVHLIGCAAATSTSATRRNKVREPEPAQLKLRLVDFSSKTPGEVAVYFSVDGRDRQALAQLRPEQFRIYDDGQLVSPFETTHKLASPLPAVHHVLVLVDMSSSVTGALKIDDIQAAVRTFTSRAGPTFKVGVVAFDGARRTMLIGDFDASADAIAEGLAAFRARDPSTNLNGAILDGLWFLNDALGKAEPPLKFGTLVLLTDGTDRASWTSRDEMLRAIDASDLDVFVIGMGAELNREQLQRIGRAGTVLIEPKVGEVEAALAATLARIDNYTRRFYLLSYCSPARAGSHTLRIEVTARDGSTGALDKDYSAQGFAPGCDPMVVGPLGPALRKAQQLERSRDTP